MARHYIIPYGPSSRGKDDAADQFGVGMRCATAAASRSARHATAKLFTPSGIFNVDYESHVS
jgi:hypothetical protein